MRRANASHDVPPEGSISHTVTDEEKWKKMYERICGCAKMYAVQKRAWGWSEDIANEAWLIARERGYFDLRMLSEATRKLKIFNSCEREIASDFPIENEKISSSEREALRAVLRFTSREIQHACEYVLAGENFQDAAEKVGMSSSQLSKELAHLGEKNTSKKRNTKLKNFPLFGDEPASAAQEVTA